jgi:hypothetical protein
MIYRYRLERFAVGMVASAMIALAGAASALACPFCSVESRTLTEEIDGATAAVLAKLVADAPPISTDPDNDDPDSGKATFQIVEVLRGDDRVNVGDEIKVVYFGEGERDKTFFVSGVGVENDALEWLTPLPLSETAIDYIKQLPTLPASGGERLRFFQESLEHADPLLAQDAYDEFARAPYADLKELEGHMHHDKLVEWIQSADVNPSRRRLYLTMLSVCGDEGDVPMLEEMVVSDYSIKKPILDQLVAVGKALGGPAELDMWTEIVDMEERQKKLGLDATVGCYLALRGPEGLDLIDERFLKNPKVEYTHAYMTIMALRIIGEETHAVPQERLLESMRLLLDNPEFADQVIPDLARWNDWSVLDRLTEMYKASDEKSYIRQPVVTYLTVASEQAGDVGDRAQVALAELEELDPEGVKKAKSLMAFGFLARARGTDTGSGAQRPEGDTATDNETSTASKLIQSTGYEANAAELADGESDASDIPAPDGYADAIKLAEPAEEMVDEEIVDESDDDAETEQVAAAEKTPAPTFSRMLVIGVPLAAALLLMVIYWLILRWGAV